MIAHGEKLRVTNLRTFFYSNQARAFMRAVDGVDFSVPESQTLGIVGESGSGKSISMLSIMGLLSTGPGVISGKAMFKQGEQWINLLPEMDKFTQITYTKNLVSRVDKNEKAWQKAVERILKPVRGKEIAMIFQNPKATFNPFMSVGEQIVEAIRLHTSIKDKKQAREKALDWLDKVQIKDPLRNFHKMAEMMSGGMSQRAMIAMALSAEPSLLIADEPTTGLDATIQSKIVELLAGLRQQYKTTSIVVSHDINVISRLADQVVVMYGGTVVESGPCDQILCKNTEIQHPYTRGLLLSMPNDSSVKAKGHLKVIPGDVLDTLNTPMGCRFYERCTFKTPEISELCQSQQPDLISIVPDHKVRCWLYHNNRSRQDEGCAS